MNPFIKDDITGSRKQEPVDKKTSFTESQMKRIEQMPGQKKKQGLGLSENLLDEFAKAQKNDLLMQFNNKDSSQLMDMSMDNMNKSQVT